MSYRTSITCLLCGEPTKLVLPLGNTPLANELQETWKEPELFPLNLMKCTECNHLQIDTLVDEERLYRHYLYVSNTSQSNRDYFKASADALWHRFIAGSESAPFVVDIGSNDGLFLSYLQEHGCKVLGVDPASNLSPAVQTVQEFFNADLALALKQVHGQADLITCNNCFAHNADLETIVWGIKNLLKPEGLFVFEVSYALALLKNNLFDLIYHEHIHHWTIAAAVKFFQRFGLEVFDAQLIGTHGGSVRIFVKHVRSQKHRTNPRLKKLLDKEWLAFDELVKSFPEAVASNRRDLMRTVTELKAAGKTISILGCPAKAATLCAYYGLDKTLITDVFDDNPLKIGKYSHIGIQIRPTADIQTQQPDYLLILSWNYADELVERLSDFKGRFIVPLPSLRYICS